MRRKVTPPFMVLGGCPPAACGRGRCNVRTTSCRLRTLRAPYRSVFTLTPHDLRSFIAEIQDQPLGRRRTGV